jgi:hypothetical protein
VIENQKQYGVTTAENIRIFLELFPKFEAEFEEAMVEVSENATLIFNDSAFSLCWSHLYELPFKDQLSHSLGGLLQDETFLQIFKSLASSGNQLAFIPEMLTQVTTYIDSWDELTQEEARELLPIVSAYLAMNRSTFLSLKCVLYHGCFLNELLELARAGNDKALFDSIRIDPTIIGTQTAVKRYSKAAFLSDHNFFKKLKAALNGNKTKREQANYQKMRLVFEILHEAKVTRLNDEQLYQLFVKELKLYSWNEREGGNAKALRKFADTYMKQNSTT